MRAGTSKSAVTSSENVGAATTDRGKHLIRLFVAYLKHASERSSRGVPGASHYRFRECGIAGFTARFGYEARP